MISRLAYLEGTYQFWAEYYGGQNSEGYKKLSQTLKRFSPGPLHKGWESMEEESREVYRLWCEKEGKQCEYDTVRYLIEEGDIFDASDDCVAWLVERYGDDSISNTGLCNYGHSDFVNNDMCYTRDLLNFYEENKTSVLYWVDEYCDAIGACSRLQALEGQMIETPDDMAAAFVNLAMTYLGRRLYSIFEEYSA